MNEEQIRMMTEALEKIANPGISCCYRCEGNGRLWADGKAHHPLYNGPTTACPNCDGQGSIPEENPEDIAREILGKLAGVKQ